MPPQSQSSFPSQPSVSQPAHTSNQTTPTQSNSAGSNPPSTSTTDTAKNNPRACESCRVLKVRCLPSRDNTRAALLGQCQRCAKSNRECIFTAPSRTRRRKRTDVRVKELEKEVRALSTLLRGGAGFGRDGGDGGEGAKGNERHMEGFMEVDEVRAPSVAPEAEVGTGARVTRKGGRKSPILEQRPSPSSQASVAWSPPPPYTHSGDGKRNSPSASSQNLDVVDRGLLSMAEATELFNRYVNELAPHYPVVVFPPGTTADSIRTRRPTLFLAVIAAAAGTPDPKLNMALNQEILQTYADRIVIKGEKTIELIQAMLITTVWYYPPDNFEELKFYQYIHMAATMAMDIGLGKKMRARVRDGSGASPGSESSGIEDGSVVGSESLESRRTLLACYLCCASVSLGFRRPNMLRFTNWMGESIDTLQNHPDAAPTDKRLIAWVMLQRIMEASSSSLALDDTSADVNLADPRTQLTLKGFERQLEEWKRSIRPGVMSPTLEISYHFHATILHEIALHTDYDVEDFKPPYTIDRVPKTATSTTQSTLTPSHVSSFIICLSSSHSLLNALLAMSVDELRTSPIINYVRMSYGVVVLIKLFFSAGTPNSALGRVLDPESTKVACYLEQLIPKLRLVVEGGVCRAAGKFLMILMKLGEWYKGQRLQQWEREMRDEDDLIEPLRHLDIHVEGDHFSRSEALASMIAKSRTDADEPRPLESDQSTDTPEWSVVEPVSLLHAQPGSVQAPTPQDSLDLDFFTFFDHAKPRVPSTNTPSQSQPLHNGFGISAPGTETRVTATQSSSLSALRDLGLDDLDMNIDMVDTNAGNPDGLDDWMQSFMDAVGEGTEFGWIEGGH